MDQIHEWIKKPPETSRVVTITPKAAATILGIGTDTPGLNSHNRGRKPGKIKEYAEDMTKGTWHLTGDTIKFTKSGLLGDGQNRLYACVQGAQGVPDSCRVRDRRRCLPMARQGQAALHR
jgi:hypothetical protein